MKRILIVSALLVSLLAPSINMTAQEPALKQRLTNLLKPANAKKEDIEEEVEVAVEAVPFGAVVDVDAQPAKALKLRQARLTTNLDAWVKWLQESCQLSEEQQQQLKAHNEAAIAAFLAKNQEKNGAQNVIFSTQNNQLTPVLFASERGALNLILLDKKWQEGVRKILTAEQQKQWETARESREQLFHEAYMQHLIGLIDQELFLTEKQRQQLQQVLNKQLGTMKHSRYTLTNRNYYLQQTPVSNVLQKLSVDFLSAAQQERLKDINLSNQYISFQATSGYLGWMKQLDEEVKQQKELAKRIVAVQLSYWEEEIDLSPAQKHQLELASKGTVFREVAAWKNQTEQQLKQYQEMVQQQPGQNFSFGLAYLTPKVLEKNSLWKSAQKTVGIMESKNRSSQIRLSQIDYLITLMDQELWLTTAQRDQLRKKIEAHYPHPANNIQDYTYEFQLVCWFCRGAQAAQFLEVLMPEQQAAFEAVKLQFRNQGGYYMLDMGNNNQIYVQMLQ